MCFLWHKKRSVPMNINKRKFEPEWNCKANQYFEFLGFVVFVWTSCQDSCSDLISCFVFCHPLFYCKKTPARMNQYLVISSVFQLEPKYQKKKKKIFENLQVLKCQRKRKQVSRSSLFLFQVSSLSLEQKKNQKKFFLIFYGLSFFGYYFPFLDGKSVLWAIQTFH